MFHWTILAVHLFAIINIQIEAKPNMFLIEMAERGNGNNDYGYKAPPPLPSPGGGESTSSSPDGCKSTPTTPGCDYNPPTPGHSESTPSAQVDCSGDGLYRDPDDCAVYYECSNGVATEYRNCSFDLVFNPAGYCDWPKNVNCDEYPDYNRTTTRGPTYPFTPIIPDGVPSLAQAEAMEESLTNSDLMVTVKYCISTLDSNLVDKITPGRPQNPNNVKRVEKILKESDFKYLFPGSKSEYTYRRFLQSIGKFPAVCDDYEDWDPDHICKKTLTTMFAHFTQETGGHNPNSDTEEWRQGLVWVREMACNETSDGCGYNAECDPPAWQAEAWPCGKNPDGTWKKYFGRGAKQISYNNYGPFSDAMFGTVHTLLDNPELVATSWLNLASATWFYVYPQPPKPSMLYIINGIWQPNGEDAKNKLEPGFGATIMVINGGIECSHGYEKPQAINRQNYYKKFSEYFQVDIEGEQLSCAHMSPFSKGGAGALPIYWEKNWQQEYQCMLVNYQTPYNAFKKGDYVRCVKDKFDVNLS